MIDKVQKIREEIVGIINSINLFTPDEDGKNSSYEAGKLDVASKILQIIDSMQEESQVKESAKTQHVNETCKENDDSLTRESVSENDWDAEFRKKADSYADNTFIEGVSDEGFYADNRNAIWNAVYYGAMLQKEHDKEIKKELPVSEDLEQAVNAYIGYAPEVDESSSTYGKRQAFKAGANWKEQQLIANAVDGFVIEDIEEGNGDFLLSAEYLSKDMGLKDRQKVKVIVIKDD